MHYKYLGLEPFSIHRILRQWGAGAYDEPFLVPYRNIFLYTGIIKVLVGGEEERQSDVSNRHISLRYQVNRRAEYEGQPTEEATSSHY